MSSVTNPQQQRERAETPQHVTDAVSWLRDALAQGPDAEFLAEERVDLMDFTFGELQQLAVQGLGEKKFRAQQLFGWLYDRRASSFDEMTNLAKKTRDRLNVVANVHALRHESAHESSDGTTKLTFRCRDNAVVETVFIPSEGRNTLCISSQVGCAMGCTFCWTAKMGLVRHLSAAEIVDQVVQARELMDGVNGHIGNIVFMGMGEPLHNYDNVVRAIRIITDQRGLDFSRRKITISTSGLVSALERLGHDVDVNLAVSLNATTNEQRSSIMPVNDRWDIEELMACLRAYPLERRQRITFEYVMIRDLNDTLEDAQRLVHLMRGMPAKVNVIPFNPHPKAVFQRPDEETVERFMEYLRAHHVSCFRRHTRGDDEMAACGQLGEPGDRKTPAHLRKRLERFRQAQAQAEASS